MIWKEHFNTNGFAMVHEAISRKTVEALIAEFDNRESRAGIRHAQGNAAVISSVLEQNRVKSLIEQLAPGAFVVRGIFFDKTPEANWKVAWHQDLTICVAEKLETPGYSAWSLKEGMVHVQPPLDVLQKMVTFRFHLDDCDAENGPLQVLPATHTLGRLNASQIQAEKEKQKPMECTLPAGGLLIMKPLILHASSQARQPRHRRVLHLELANFELENGLRWVR